MSAELTRDIVEMMQYERDEFLTDTSPSVMELDGEREAQMAERQAQMASEAMDAYRGSPAEAMGPKPSRYDYTAAHAAGTDFSQGTLPNQYEHQGVRMVQGRDAANGAPVLRPPTWQLTEEAEALERAGLEQLRASSRSVEGIAPDTDVPALSRLALAAQLQGAESFDEWRDVLGDSGHDLFAAQAAWEAAERAVLRSDIEAALADFSLNIGPAEIADPPFEMIDPDTLHNDPTWLDASRTWFKFREGMDWNGSDQELAKYGLQEMAEFNWNLAKMGDYAIDIADAGDENVALSFAHLLDTFDKVDASWGGAGRALGAAASDPFTYLGLGVGTMAYKGASKAAARAGIRKILHPIIATTAAGAAEGGAMGGATEASRQTVEATAGLRDGIDTGEIGRQAMASGIGGAVVGGGIATGVALSPAAQKMGREMLAKLRARK